MRHHYNDNLTITIKNAEASDRQIAESSQAGL